MAISLFGHMPVLGQDAAEQTQLRVIDIASHVTEASKHFGLPENWIYAVIRTESAGKIGAVSSAGAIGLMQLMPGTWARQRARFALGNDPFDPRDNIMAGTSYLREMYDNYGASGFLAAYNAGPGRYEQYRDDGRPLPAETRAYVAKIEPMLQSGSTPTVVASALTVQSSISSWRQSELFAVRNDDAVRAAPRSFTTDALPAAAAPKPRLDGLFVPVSENRSQ
jgi:hypothetical protein